MRIAFVSDTVYPYNKGGKEKRLYEISKQLAKMGHDVHIYCMHMWPTPEKTRVENGLTLHGIGKFHTLYKGDRRSITQGILFGFACFKLINIKFDVIDVDHMPFFPIFSVWIICKLRGRKMYGTWHEALRRSDWVSYMGPAGNIAALIERASIRLPYAITVSSAHTLELIKSELNRNKRLSLVTPGIDKSAISKAKPVKTSCDVLFVGRLVKDKNVSLLVKAIAELKKKHPNIQCTIIGSGIEITSITRLVAKLDLTANITLLDNLPTANDIYAYMKAAKVLALPSTREGFGMVALEALACGTPVVTLNAPANAAKDLVSDHINGSVVNRSASSLAEGINCWLQQSPGQNALSKLVRNYDWKALATKQAEVYAT